MVVGSLEHGSDLERLAFLGGLMIFRLRNSGAFRVAALSIAVHLVALYLLLQHWVPAQAVAEHTRFIVKLPPAKAEPVGLRPSEAFVERLSGRNRSIEVKLGKAAVPGQANAIRSRLTPPKPAWLLPSGRPPRAR